MKPSKQNNQQGYLFEPRLSKILDMKHPLIKLSATLDWKTIEENFSNFFVDKIGQPAKPVRLVVGIMMLQNMYGMSDENIVYRWVENPYWQYFCGVDFLQYEMPMHPTSLVRWRHRIGQEGFTELLANTISAAIEVGVVKKKSREGYCGHHSNVQSDRLSYRLWAVLQSH